jgi:hypothetical protein
MNLPSRDQNAVVGGWIISSYNRESPTGSREKVGLLKSFVKPASGIFD